MKFKQFLGAQLEVTFTALVYTNVVYPTEFNLYITPIYLYTQWCWNYSPARKFLGQWISAPNGVYIPAIWYIQVAKIFLFLLYFPILIAQFYLEEPVVKGFNYLKSKVKRKA